jgi:hypothetical protein
VSYAKFRDMLAEANKPEFYPIHWLDRQVQIGMAVPIVGEQSAMVVGTRIYPGGARVGHIKAAAGDMDELITVLGPRAEEWGREHGCTIAMIEGRPGWSRTLKEHGWSAHQVALLKEL